MKEKMKAILEHFVNSPVNLSRIVMLAWLGSCFLLITFAYVAWSDGQILQENQKFQTTQLEDRSRTLDLSIEFGFDPLIVQVTRQLAKDVFATRYCDCPTWRFVKTPDELAYVILSVIQAESGGNFRAYNASGASGLTQMLLSTARQYDKELQPAELFTIPKHLRLAMTHFVELLEKYQGNVALTVISWNRGSGAVDRLVSMGQSPDNNYAYTVFTQAAIRNATR